MATLAEVTLADEIAATDEVAPEAVAVLASAELDPVEVLDSTELDADEPVSSPSPVDGVPSSLVVSTYPGVEGLLCPSPKRGLSPGNLLNGPVTSYDASAVSSPNFRHLLTSFTQTLSTTHDPPSAFRWSVKGGQSFRSNSTAHASPAAYTLSNTPSCHPMAKSPWNE